jgi:hypothetical protein
MLNGQAFPETCINETYDLIFATFDMSTINSCKKDIHIYAILQYSVDPSVTLYGRITARKYVDMWGNLI